MTGTPDGTNSDVKEKAASSAIPSIVADIVSAYVSNNSVPVADLPTLISDVNAALLRLSTVETEPSAEPLKPAVPVKRSLHSDHIVCLEDGLKFKSLRRHLLTHHGMSPEEYREKWGLPSDYPMVAPDYSDARSALAKKMGLGRKKVQTMRAPAKKAPVKRAG
ncbi:MAG: MucR family transcriptional regulator [Mesorhizobium sp.]